MQLLTSYRIAGKNAKSPTNNVKGSCFSWNLIMKVFFYVKVSEPQPMRFRKITIVGEVEEMFWFAITSHTQPAFTCSKLTIETLEQGVKYAQS